jgi:branched-subunit amino acid aminotransferase/4-amino-4-deoxychorismate lyase
MPEIISIRKGGRLELEPGDGGFAYGEGLFETLRLVDGGLCFWEAHWARLAASALALGFDLPEEAAVLLALRKWLAAEDRNAGIIKLSLVRRGETCTLYIYGRESSGARPNRVRARVERETRLNPASLLAGHKSHNYMEAMALWRAAQAAGYHDCLRLNSSGHLAEACIANLFFLKAGVLHTPALETGILPGVIRAEVLRLAPEENLETSEGYYEPEALAEAEAIFLTNSVAGLVPLASVEGVFEGPLTEHPALVGLVARLASAEKLASVIP